ncbi:hypothetical protein Ddye_004745 [Dipteronia dyeriana]|uniref:Uncharacterized protein n=1 Tax=Dipteronia dyeriana TaxID=168575 RepID=A0AAE0CP15_9ROSI|nr:hypothetical protein Ddye_004745 [Dipteronia dyeriana]
MDRVLERKPMVSMPAEVSYSFLGVSHWGRYTKDALSATRRGEQQDPSSTQSSHDPISSAQVTEDLPSRVTRSQGQAPAQMPLPPKSKIFPPKSTPARKEVILHPSIIPG